MTKRSRQRRWAGEHPSINHLGASGEADRLLAEIQDSGALPESRLWARLCDAVGAGDEAGARSAIAEIHEVLGRRAAGGVVASLDLYVDEHLRMPDEATAISWKTYKSCVVQGDLDQAGAALAQLGAQVRDYFATHPPKPKPLVPPKVSVGSDVRLHLIGKRSRQQTEK